MAGGNTEPCEVAVCYDRSNKEGAKIDSYKRTCPSMYLESNGELPDLSN